MLCCLSTLKNKHEFFEFSDVQFAVVVFVHFLHFGLQVILGNLNAEFRHDFGKLFLVQSAAVVFVGCLENLANLRIAKSDVLAWRYKVEKIFIKNKAKRKIPFRSGFCRRHVNFDKSFFIKVAFFVSESFAQLETLRTRRREAQSMKKVVAIVVVLHIYQKRFRK